MAFSKAQTAAQSWKTINNGLEQHFADVLAFDPSNTKIIYAGAGHTLFKSTDGGAIWAKTNNGLNQADVNAIAIDPSNTKIIFAGTARGLFKSTNGGADWTLINITPTRHDIASIAIDPLAMTLQAIEFPDPLAHLSGICIRFLRFIACSKKSVPDLFV